MTDLNDRSIDHRSSLSAMFDGEATEKDIECLLSEDASKLSRQLEGFHLIQQTLHKDSSIGVGLEDSLLLNIRSQIDADEDKGLDIQAATMSSTSESAFTNEKVISFESPVKQKASKSVWQTAFSSVAVAASVTFVVIFGGNTLLAPDDNQTNNIADVELPTNRIEKPVSNDKVISLAELNESGLKIDNARLQNYLRQHAEQGSMAVGQGMIPMARVVSYPVKE